jgi:hypothetical protein
MKKTLLFALALAAPAFAAEPPPLAYPHGYREWTHVKTVQLKPGHMLYQQFGGIHHIYANKKAMEGYRRGKFPNGATIVFDLLEANEESTAVSEGARKFIGVMHKDARKYAATGGWAFEAFKGDSKKERLIGKRAEAACFQCHAGQKQRDYVFSGFRN